MISNCGEIYSKVIDRKLSMVYSPAGYASVNLRTINNQCKIYYVHILVSLLFIPNLYPDYRNTVNHKNFDTTNNMYINLEWLSKVENIYHENFYSSIIKPNTELVDIDSLKKSGWGSKCNGSKNGMSKWTEEIVHNLCRLVSEGYNYKEALETVGIEYNYNMAANLSHIIRGYRWKHISSQYTFHS